MSKKQIKIIHLRQNCIGCNSCVENAPDNWEMSLTDGKANLKRAEENKGRFIAEICEIELEANKRAAADCPVGIIKIVNE